MTISATPVGTRFTGPYYVRGEDGYEAARLARIFSTRHPKRYPAAILVPHTEQDIIEGVRLAQEQGWQVGVRAGGHSFPVWGMRDNALLIDLGEFKEMEYDHETHIVSVTPAVQGGVELNTYLQPHGRFFAGGRCPTVGVGGFLLQGGIGWNFRGWGWAVERLVAIDVVTAAGELVRADESQNADLFWAARGCGPGFPGLITRFHIHTRAIPQALTTTKQFFPIERYAEVLAWLNEAQKAMPKDNDLLGISFQPDFEIPGHSGGYVFGISATAYCDTAEEAQTILAPLADNPFLTDALLVVPPTPTTLADEYAFVDAAHPAGYRYRVESAWVDGPHTDIASALKMLVAERPIHEKGYTFFQYALPIDGPDIAMSMRTDLMVGAYIIYSNPEDDEHYRQWALDAMKPLEPYSVGQYWGDSDQEHREVRCLTDEAWSRVRDVRRAWDPDQRFVDYLAGPDGYQNRNGWQEA
ncbi:MULTISPECIES: FAD-binding oxidoreductase [Streptomyces]|uniref:FAD-binding oxidoreductase n=1 Tax=Streptomyces rhizosphaericus TaxID=114699 RepID=A0A6G4AJK3_9ACTN|nr:MULTISPECIES: FAD-binding oxidoreductase [Streptomyces]EXU64121.1 FAD-binding oxidoreductase [Streptomyces sp. PRh5]NEW72677.1 FAD-binding oxidoreductase [Streptomyces rhizosphaericus]